jgi:predicted dehydrogenase
MSHANLTRRAFLATSTLAATAAISGCATGPNSARVVPGKISPNEKLNIGVIGLGGRARSVMNQCKGLDHLHIGAASDCFQPRIEQFIKGLERRHSCTGHADFRNMIEKENLDGVMVETTTHARAWVSCHAMAMGMDVYIEKPMALTIAEGREMVNCARKYDRVTQIGTQQRSMPVNNWISDLVKDGAAGKIHTVRACNYIGAVRYTGTEGQPLPKGGDNWWDIWTNQAELRPYHELIQRRWNKWWAYDGGGTTYGVTGWGAHGYDQIQRGLGTDETGPVEIVLQEEVADRRTGKFEREDIPPEDTGSPYYGMADQVGPRAKVWMKYKNGVELQLDMDGDRSPGLGCVYVGDRGAIELNRNMYTCDPDTLVDPADKPTPLGVPETHPHVENWLECIKTRATCNADIEYGQRSSSLCYLVNIARDVGKVGQTLQWNPKKEQFRNCPEGNAMLSRPRRTGYELPT